MISKDKTYRTRDGREVRIYATDGREYYPIHGAIGQDGGWQINCWTQDGLHSLRSKYDDSADLIEVKPRIKRTVWLNVFDGATSASDTPIWHGVSKRIACVKIEIDCEEGEGL
jgi:hypothetical protein